MVEEVQLHVTRPRAGHVDWDYSHVLWSNKGQRGQRADEMPDKSIVYPKADHATFRDLNIFEERLRDTAAGLQRRKSRYQCMWLANFTSVLGSDGWQYSSPSYLLS